MFAKENKNPKTGRVILTINESYRVNKVTRQRQVLKLGFYDELLKEHADPKAWADEYAIQLTKEKKEKEALGTIVMNENEKIVNIKDVKPENRSRKNIGSAALSKIYHELEIDEFINNRRVGVKKKEGCNLNNLFQIFVYDRIMSPGSILSTFNDLGNYFINPKATKNDMYSSLDFFLKYRDDLLTKLDQMVAKQYGRETVLTYYDVTNYYFEIQDEDDDNGLRHKGVSKEHRKDPIVQMGLIMDEKGIPVSYELFKGNNNDCTTLIPVLDSDCLASKRNKMIIVADKGMMTGENIAKIRQDENGYVISYSVRKANKKFVDYVLDPSGYDELYDPETKELEFKSKSRYAPREIWVTKRDKNGEPLLDKNGEPKKTKAIINEKQIVFYSRNYAERAAHERDKAVAKAKKLVGAMSKSGNEFKFGTSKYIRKTPVDKKTGELLQETEFIVSLDEEVIDLEAQLDGYYVICTNVDGLIKGDKPWPNHGEKYRYTKDGFFQQKKVVTDWDIIEIYRGLWRIEDTFRVTKSDLKARPVFVWTDSHIRAHFLICFVALLLLRIIQFRLNWKYSGARIKESLIKTDGMRFDNVFAFDYYDDVLKDIGENLDIDFSKRYRTLLDIRKLFGNTKK